MVQRNRSFVNYCSSRTSRSLRWIYIRFKHRYTYTYFISTISNISQNLKQPEKSVTNYFIKSLFNGYECNDMERELFELTAKYGGLRKIKPSKISDREYRHSRILTQ